METSNDVRLAGEDEVEDDKDDQVFGDSEDTVNIIGGDVTPHRRRRKSGSYGGAYESDEDIGHGNEGTTNGEEERLKKKLKFFFMNPV